MKLSESNLRSKWDDNISDRVEMVAIAWMVEMKLRGIFTTYPKNREARVLKPNRSPKTVHEMS